jgi:hypothetical protein
MLFARCILGAEKGEALVRALGMDPRRSLFYFALSGMAQQASVSYWEFGVGWGDTLTRYINALKAFCRDNHRNIYSNPIVLFDSFEGLPEKEDRRDGDGKTTMVRGSFSHDVNEIGNAITNSGILLDKGNIQFVKGFFKDTLTSSLRDELTNRAPHIVTIDVDYYSSARTVLEWLWPMLRSGTIFYFRHIWSAYDGNPRLGELAAIHEFNESGKGLLTPYPVLGTTWTTGQSYIYSTS